MTQSTLNPWKVLNLVILVWQLGIRLLNLHEPDWHSALLLNYTFTLVSMDKVSTLTPSYFNQAVRIYPLLDQTVKDFQHCLDSILMDSVSKLEQDASLMKLMPCILQSFQGFYAWLVAILII